MLTLCRLHDVLFDKVYLSFNNDGYVNYSSNEIFKNNGIEAFLSKSYNKLEITINEAMKNYIKYHFDYIFEKNGVN